MRKLLFLFSAVLFLAGCGNDDYFEESWQNGVIDSNIPKVIYATIANEQDETADAKTRTYVKDDKQVLWHNGDAISYITGSSHLKYQFNGNDGTANADFTYVEACDQSSNEASGTYAVYPFGESNACDASGNLSVVYPTEQTYALNSFGKGANLMVAASAAANEKNLYFRNACGYLVIKLYGEGIEVAEIKLTALGDGVKIAGAASITTNGEGVPTVTMGDDASSEVTLDCSNGGSGVALGATKETATEFWFALPAVTMEGGMKILVTDKSNRAFEMQTTKEVVIHRNKIQPMAALEFKSNVATPYQLLYTTSDGNKIDFSHLEEETWGPFNADIKTHTYADGKGIITFKEPLTHINERAFYEKSALTSVTFPKSLLYIGKQAFYHTALTEVTFPESLENIDILAFYETPITSVTFAEGLKNIGRHAFYDTNITSLTIPGSVTSIGYKAFQSCYELTTIEFKPSPTASPLTIYLEDPNPTWNAPFYHSPLTTVILNRELVIKVGDKLSNGFVKTNGMFVAIGTNMLTSVTLGEQVKTITNNMFEGAQFTSLTIPGNVTKIGVDAFSDCDKLTSLTFESGTEDLQISHSVDEFIGEWGAFRKTKLRNLVLDRNLVPTYTIDEDDDGIFAEIETLYYVTIGPNVKTIGNRMFLGTSINNITIPGNVTSIDTYAFYNCPNLKSVTIGNGVKTIGYGAFRGTPITSLTIPGSLTKIDDYAFFECRNLSDLRFESGSSKISIHNSQTNYGPFSYSPLTNIHLDREVLYLDTDGNSFEPNNKSEGLFTKFRSIANSAISITLGPNVKNILSYMFAELNITSLNIGSGVETIGHGAFLSTPITSLTIPASVTKIGSSAFRDTQISSLTIPASVTTIENDAFHGCSMLTSLTFKSGAADLKIGPTLELSNEFGPFYDTKLETLVLDRNLVPTYTINGDEEGLFSQISTLRNVTLGNNVKTIGNRMFLKSAITSIAIPGSVSKIGLYAFYDCESLSNLRFEAGSGEISIVNNGYYGSPFYYSPLTTLYLDRTPKYIDDEGAAFTPEDDDEAMFYSNVTDKGLTSVTIGGNVTTIGNNVFNGCPKITSVTFEAGTQPLTLGYDTEFDDSDYGVGRGPFLNSPNINTVVLNRNINYSFGGEVDANTYNSVIRASIFNNNHTLTNITIGEGVTSLPDYAFAGAGLSGKDIRLHDGLQTIGKYAFYDAQINGGIYIPASVTTIKDGAFRMNNNSKITCLGTTPATIEGTPFKIDVLYYKISVPAASVDAYKEAWSTYSNQIQAITE